MIEAASDSGAAQVVAPDDGSVIDALRRGDEARSRASSTSITRAFAALPACTSLANRAVGDEVVQDTWLGVIRGS
jgi:hypothetical protein